MALDKEELKSLLSSVAGTRDGESNCDECLAGMAEFAEAELVGAKVSVALERVEAHMLLCPECAEEYGILLEVLRSSSSDLP